MQINLYKTKNKHKALDKELILVKEMVDGSLRDSSEIKAPVIRIKATNPTKCDYAYVDVFHRYYYITDFTQVRTDIWDLHLFRDPAYTFRECIRKCYAVIDKQQKNTFTTENYNDGSFHTREDNFTEVWNFSDGFNDDGNFILLTAGKINGGE